MIAAAPANGAASSISTLTLIKGALKIMVWTKTRTAIVAGVVAILATGTATTLIVKHSSRRPATNPIPSEQEYFAENVQKANRAKQWAVAFIVYASQHQNQLPKSFDELKSGAPEGDSDWEIVSTGKWRGMTEMARTILLREREARRTSGGAFAKTYAFADGHVELVTSSDNNFAALERRRRFLTASSGD